MMVDNTSIGPLKSQKPNEQNQSSENSVTSQEEGDGGIMEDKDDSKEKERTDSGGNQGKRDDGTGSDKSPGRTRTKSNQRWMKLRTTVQLSGAISSTNQKSKPPLKREDSFLKRFSTRQIPETQETVDTGDETETMNGSQTQNEVNRRRRKRRKELSKTVVNPDENFYFYWLMTVTVCVLYNLWTLIVRQSFPELQKAASLFWYTGDGFADVVFVCDIVVQFRTGYLEQGLMVYNSKKLATHYLKSRAFVLDLLSLLPLDFLQFNFGVNPILRFPRFLKIYRVYNYYYIVESRTVYPNLWRVVNLIHILLILAHWFGCFYYLLSEAEGFQGDWVYPYRPGDYATLTRKYLGSLYWSTLTLTTIGDLPTPETNAESGGRSKAMTPTGDTQTIPRRGHKSRLLQFNSNYGYLFTIVSYLIGVFIFATIVGQVGNVITNRNANRLEFERLLDGAKTYMRHHKVPGGMKRRVLRWYDYSWSRGRIQGGGDINTALGLLPDKLKTELALHVNLSVLKKVTIFQECQPEFLHDLVLKMKAYIFTPGDLICRKGEVAREMFIIADGILDVISETGRVLTTMKAGDFFGEIGILNLDGLNKRTADVRSVGYSELFSLSREDVLTAMKDYPEAQEILQSLGRKRLMEAKNASKIHKSQNKQAKDHDSSGDSDTAGKRIVEKLRSDVKGLKNALRRSRRGTRTKQSLDGYGENDEKSSNKKHSILRRMSHVQSSDEYETTSDMVQSPIGAGLPLLQRLKLLKEKQEKEREEKEKHKSSIQASNLNGKDDNSEPELIGAGLPLTQRLKVLKQKEEKEAAAAAVATAANTAATALTTAAPLDKCTASTVRTQVTGIRPDKPILKIKTVTSSKETEGSSNEEEATKVTKKKESSEVVKTSFKEKLKLVHGSYGKEKNLPSKIVEDRVISPSSNATTETHHKTSINVPIASEAENSVPKLGSKFVEVPKSKDGWKLLKKSSITSGKVQREDSKSVKKVSKKGTYLSKSDTILEKQKTLDSKEEEKRSRSISPQNGSKSQKKTLKQTVEILIKERRKIKLLGEGVENSETGNNKIDIASGEVTDNCTEPREIKQSMKKYDSISDLSPEYSGLPFVKKLKILNERQKLAELEKELLVRSASLDEPDRSSSKRENVLVRSQSEASTIDFKRNIETNLRSELEARWRNATLSDSSGEHTKDDRDSHTNLRIITIPGKAYGNRLQSEGSMASPEGNETLERRHLKSILKKLSAEDSTSDEDQASRSFRSWAVFKKSDNAELKKLMRAPTVEGYAARHKKLTKSVTFDSDTFPSPPDPVATELILEETKGKGFSPMSPTAILTLQLSNLSMIPIVSPKKTEKIESGEKIVEEAKMEQKEKVEIETIIPKVLKKLQEEVEKLRPGEKGTDKESPLMPYIVQEIGDRNFRMLPFTKNQDDALFGEIMCGIQQIVQGLLEDVRTKFQCQFNSLQTEVKKRDEIIFLLQSKIQQLEQKNQAKANNRKTEDTNPDSSGTDPDLSDIPFLRGDSFETILGMNSPVGEPSSVSVSPNTSPSRVDTSGVQERFRFALRSPKDSVESNLPFDYMGNIIPYREKERNSETEETEDDMFEIKDKKCLLSNTNVKDNPLKRRLQKSLDTGSDEEMELLDVSRFSRLDDFVRKKHRTEFKLKRNFSVDETSLETVSETDRKKPENRLRGKSGNKIMEFQRSFSYAHENKDFFTLDIDDSSNSSDIENPHNGDWEVQMLAEELVKKEKAAERHWETEENEDEWLSESEAKAERLEGVKKLQEEVNTLKQMVRESDLRRLTSSELDMLETIIEAKDQKISQIAKSNSLDEEDKNSRQRKTTHIYCSVSDNKLEKHGQRKKPSLRQKIGQAFSFDFHEIENRKSKSSDRGKRKFPLRKQRTISGSYQEQRSLYNLWHTSSLLRNRVLEKSNRVTKNISNDSSSSVDPSSSLPILISSSLCSETNQEVRTSLPILTAEEFRTNFVEGFKCSVSSSEDGHKDADFKESCDSVFEDTDNRYATYSENKSLLEFRQASFPSTSGQLRLNEAHSNTGLNSFIKSVGQKVKQVMAGDVNPTKSQVPTISKLCDEQSILKDPEIGRSGDFGRTARVPSEEDVKDNESSKILDSFDCNPKMEPPDL